MFIRCMLPFMLKISSDKDDLQALKVSLSRKNKHSIASRERVADEQVAREGNIYQDWFPARSTKRLANGLWQDFLAEVTENRLSNAEGLRPLFAPGENPRFAFQGDEPCLAPLNSLNLIFWFLLMCFLKLLRLDMCFLIGILNLVRNILQLKINLSSSLNLNK